MWRTSDIPRVKIIVCFLLMCLVNTDNSLSCVLLSVGPVCVYSLLVWELGAGGRGPSALWELFMWQIAPSDMSRSPDISELSVTPRRVCSPVSSMQSEVLVSAAVTCVDSHTDTQYNWQRTKATKSKRQKTQIVSKIWDGMSIEEMEDVVQETTSQTSGLSSSAFLLSLVCSFCVTSFPHDCVMITIQFVETNSVYHHNVNQFTSACH